MKEISQKQKQELIKKSDEILDRIFENPDSVPDHTIVMSAESYSSLLSKKKIALLSYLKKYHPDSLGAIAKGTKRKKQAINRDIRDLEAVGIIKLKKNGRKKIPEIIKNMIVVTL